MPFIKDYIYDDRRNVDEEANDELLEDDAAGFTDASYMQQYPPSSCPPTYCALQLMRLQLTPPQPPPTSHSTPGQLTDSGPTYRIDHRHLRPSKKTPPFSNQTVETLMWICMITSRRLSTSTRLNHSLPLNRSPPLQYISTPTPATYPPVYTILLRCRASIRDSNFQIRLFRPRPPHYHTHQPSAMNWVTQPYNPTPTMGRLMSMLPTHFMSTASTS